MGLIIRGYSVYQILNRFNVNSGSQMGLSTLIKIIYFCCMYPNSLKSVPYETKMK